MLTKADIRFRRSNYEDGFGFSCLKAAYHFGIKGRMDYSIHDGVMIKAEGESKNVREFLHWIEGNVYEIDGLQYSYVPSDETKFKEFDLCRHFG
jgi:acylphosphatase